MDPLLMTSATFEYLRETEKDLGTVCGVAEELVRISEAFEHYNLGVPNKYTAKAMYCLAVGIEKALEEEIPTESTEPSNNWE